LLVHVVGPDTEVERLRNSNPLTTPIDSPPRRKLT
jgi:hypothetical protein